MSTIRNHGRATHARKQAETTNIDSIRRHYPLITIRRFTKSGPFALYSELCGGKCVFEEGCAGDVDICIVFHKGSRVAYIWTLRGIANLLSDVVD